ncbi:MAG: radical SAM protein [Desulfurivibrio sp.]|nr:MAG: radical SAM protein [Desulfurivibrio sp.]
MSIMLINPSGGYHHEYPPQGLLSLAAYLRTKGREVHFLDEGALSAPKNEFLDGVRKYSPKYVGLSLYTTNISRCYQLIRAIKGYDRSIRIIVGGPHATAMPEYTLRECPEIDFLVAGEGEITLEELLDTLDSGREAAGIKGVYSRSGEDGGVLNFAGEREYLADLDSLPFPAHDLVDLDTYQKNPISVGKRIGAIITSRGCPFNCVFCNKAVFKSVIRRRSVARVIEEIQFLINNHGVDEIYFQDDLFALDKKWLYEFMDKLRDAGITIPWRMLVRVDILGYEDYAALKKAGCYLLQFGVESGSDIILKDIKKNISKAKVIEAFRAARENGLQTYGFFIFGHRLDTKKSILETFAFAKKIQCDFTSFFLLVPFPGTKVYQYLPDNLKHDWQRIQYINWNKDLDPISICEVPGGELAQFEEQVNMEFYGRFSYLLNNVFHQKNYAKMCLLKFRWWLRNTLALARHIAMGRERIFKISS